MILYSFSEMKEILWGSHIRIFELANHLNAKLIRGSSLNRLIHLPIRYPKIFFEKNILLVGYYPTKIEIELLKKCKKNILFDIADIPFLQAKYFGVPILNEPKLRRKFLELINISNKLLIVSPTLKNLLDEDLSKKEVIFVSNGANHNFFKKTPLHVSGKKTILCVTGYAPNRGIETLVEAFKLLKDSGNNELKLVGYNMPTIFSSDNIIVENDKFYAEMPDIFSRAYLSIIPHKKNPYMDSALPLKLFDSMASARPVVVTNCEEMANLVLKEKCGLVVDDSAKSIANAISYLLESPDESIKMGLNGRDAIEKRYSWEIIAKNILNKIDII
jgi:glycosyltransferase involved in cell wall biosynthesis